MTRLTLMLCAAAVAWPIAARAQDGAPAAVYDSEPPAHIAFVEGGAVLERDGRLDSSPSNMPLLSGDRVRTQGGRVEILFGDGSTLHLDANTTVDFQSDELVRLLAGRIRLSIPGPNRTVSYRVDAPFAWARFSQPGEYRMAILAGERETEIELAVLRGAAELSNEDGGTPLRAGERAFSRANAAPSLAYMFNSASWDAFDRWSEARHDERRALVSTQYLPEQVRPYAASFDQYGSWRQDASYGYVWYPTVSTGWRPYYNGRWETLRPYGWTWIGSDAWAWPTHHYGRWGVSAGSWFWIPGRSWAPAWVSWAYAPGYVSWCPLGWNDGPVVQVVNVNIYNRGYDPWRAWTAVPQRHFEGRYVNVRGASGDVIDSRTRGAFVPGNRAPASGGYAVPRGSAPIRVAGTGSPRRGTSPVYSNLEPRDARVTGPSRTVVPQGTAESQGSRERPDAAAARRSRAYPRNTPTESAAPDASAERSRRNPVAASPGVTTGQRYDPDSPRARPRGERSYRTTPMPSPGTAERSAERSAGRSAERSSERSADRSTDRSAERSAERSSQRAAPTPYGVTRSAPRGDDYRRDPMERRQPDRPPEMTREPGMERRGPRAAPGGNIPRAAPRESAPRESAPPQVQRQSPGVERRAPMPDRPSAPPGGASHTGPPPTGASRPHSGGQPSGTAVRRPGGG